MRYFFDTEFIEDGRMIDLISIGIVAEDGRELYAESLDVDLSKANAWVQTYVLPRLWSRPNNTLTGNVWSGTGGVGGLLSRQAIAREIRLFCDPATYGEPEVWAYYADYDWVALRQLFGQLADLPAGWPGYCRNLRQLADMLGSPSLPEQISTEHHALHDARWTRDTWEYLRRWATEKWEGPELSVLLEHYFRPCDAR